MTRTASGATSATSDTPHGFGYQPALDGLRALAVVLVLLFHQGFAWMTGGYIGVSVFFTLSGFLITSLLLIEHHSTGRVSFGGFYRRRLARLMPASLLCLVAIAVLGAAGAFPLATGLRADVVAATLQVANWHALTRGTSYAQMIQRGVSPVDHFWSLSIEEQFYWVWPIAFAGIAMAARTRRAKVVAIGTLAGLAVIAAPLVALHWGPDAAYWATPARLGEILVGAALAAVLDAWRRRPTWLAAITWPSLALVVLAAVSLPSGHGPAYDGLLGVGALVSAALIAGLQVDGPVRWVLSARPVVALGRISYGVYLFHWPVYVVLDEARIGRGGVALFAARIAVTLAIATVSYVAIERPVRTSGWSLPRVGVLAVSATAITIALTLVVVPLDRNDFGGDENAAEQVTISPRTAPLVTLRPDTTDGASISTGPGPTALPTPARPVRILVIGDSTAEALSAGLVDWAVDHPDLAQVDVLAQAGCGLVRADGMDGDDGTLEAECRRTLQRDLPVELESRTPDVVVVLVTLPDAIPRRWSSDEGWLDPTDPRYQERLAGDYADMAGQLLAVPDLRIAWLSAAMPAEWCLCRINSSFDRSMWQGQRDAVAAIDAAHPDRVARLDFDGWVTGTEETGDRSLREDGLHLTATAARSLVDDHLAVELLTLAVGG